MNLILIYSFFITLIFPKKILKIKIKSLCHKLWEDFLVYAANYPAMFLLLLSPRIGGSNKGGAGGGEETLLLSHTSHTPQATRYSSIRLWSALAPELADVPAAWLEEQLRRQICQESSLPLPIPCQTPPLRQLMARQPGIGNHWPDSQELGQARQTDQAKPDSQELVVNG